MWSVKPSWCNSSLQRPSCCGADTVRPAWHALSSGPTSALPVTCACHPASAVPGAYPEALWGRFPAASASGRACCGAPGMPCSKQHSDAAVSGYNTSSCRVWCSKLSQQYDMLRKAFLYLRALAGSGLSRARVGRRLSREPRAPKPELPHLQQRSRPHAVHALRLLRQQRLC